VPHHRIRLTAQAKKEARFGWASDRYDGQISVSGRNPGKDVIGAARTLGSSMHDPFMALSFLALEVIPHLKLTDQGLVDVDQFKIVPLWVE